MEHNIPSRWIHEQIPQLSADSAIAPIHGVLREGVLEGNIVLDGAAMALGGMGSSLVDGCLLYFRQDVPVDLASCGSRGRMRGCHGGILRGLFK